MASIEVINEILARLEKLENMRESLPHTPSPQSSFVSFEFPEGVTGGQQMLIESELGIAALNCKYINAHCVVGRVSKSKNSFKITRKMVTIGKYREEPSVVQETSQALKDTLFP